jgi:hypothetical protein
MSPVYNCDDCKEIVMSANVCSTGMVEFEFECVNVYHMLIRKVYVETYNATGTK